MTTMLEFDVAANGTANLLSEKFVDMNIGGSYDRTANIGPVLVQPKAGCILHLGQNISYKVL